MSERGSYRQILRSSSIIGGSSAINILIGLVRIKIVAVMLGPAGVGLIGLMQSLMTTATTISALGFGTVGTGQIGKASGQSDLIAETTARRALAIGTLFLALIGGGIFWLLRGQLANHVLSDSSLTYDVGWLGLGVALSVLSGSQGALLRGLRRTGDIARVSVYAALLSSIASVFSLFIWGEKAIVIFVLSAPIASFVLGLWYVSKVSSPDKQQPVTSAVFDQLKTLVRLGAAFMVTGGIVAIGNLIMRALVQRQLGVEALGHFQASWAITMTYIGFVLTAMGTDFYPRLSAAIHDHELVNQLVNQQSEVALLLAGPVILMMLGLAPWVIELLYSSKFNDAVMILRWQILGDVLKIVTWPLGIIILAAGDSRTYMFTETLGIAVLVGLTAIGLPLIGIDATGIAFLAMYLLYLPLVYWLAARRTGFAWDKRVARQFIVLVALVLIVFLTAIWSRWFGAISGVLAAMGLGLHGMARLGGMAEFHSGVLGHMTAISQKLMRKIGMGNE